MRVIHERKRRKLKRLDDRGAEAHKVDSTRKLVRSLSTKIRIAIQVVDKISVTINKIRDEELWPQLSDFIQGYVYLLVICKIFADSSLFFGNCVSVSINIIYIYLLQILFVRCCLLQK